jgi:flagellar biosynthesis protein FlhF
MTMKRFEARSMPEALQQVRAELGSDAVILETRHVKGGLFGSGDRVTVLATKEEARPQKSQIEDKLEDIISLLRPVNPIHPERERVAAKLAESGVDETLLEELLAENETDFSEARLVAEIIRRVPVVPSLPVGGCKRVALVGPTGVGKTTTIAKLAARYAITEGKKVALITMDTYRVGAVDQLRTYARVMNLPFEVVESPEEMEAAVARHEDKDLVLIDTVGRNPRKALQLAEIQTFLNAAQTSEVHLVLSVPYGTGYLLETAQQFSILKPNRLILTKLDELPRWGVIASIVARTGWPVSFLTDGQEVPRNLRPANASEIALNILGGSE